jgi:uncharacterized membrane protein SpoIIM required for sporulation
MVLESLVNPRYAQRHYIHMVLIGFLYTSVAMIFSFVVFRRYVGLIMVFMTALLASHIIYGTIKFDEKRAESSRRRPLIKDHGKTLALLTFLFLGFVLAFSAWYLILPAEIVDSVYSTQTQTIEGINQRVLIDEASGSVLRDLHAAGAVSAVGILGEILLNNYKLLVITFIFAFVFGFGAIFIFAWNASLIGTAIGNYVRNGVGGNYFTIYPIGVARYMTHGIIEFLGFFMAGLAGGIISVAIIKHEFGTEKFFNVLTDSVDLIIVSIILMFVAGLIEVFITPAIFL